MHYRNSTSLSYSCNQLFDLVSDIESYPAFLPGWKDARILQRQGNRLHAEQHLRAGPAVFCFDTTALLEPCARIRIHSSNGPFRELAIDWRFEPIDDQQCRVSIEMTSSIRPGLKNGLLQLALETGSSELLPLFERRAHALYG